MTYGYGARNREQRQTGSATIEPRFPLAVNRTSTTRHPAPSMTWMCWGSVLSLPLRSSCIYQQALDINRGQSQEGLTAISIKYVLALALPRLGNRGIGGSDMGGSILILRAWCDSIPEAKGVMWSTMTRRLSGSATWRRFLRILMAWLSSQSWSTTRTKYTLAPWIGCGSKKSCTEEVLVLGRRFWHGQQTGEYYPTLLQSLTVILLPVLSSQISHTVLKWTVLHTSIPSRMTDSLSWMTIFKWENALARVIVGLPVPPPTSTITLPCGIEVQSKPERWVHHRLYKGIRQTLQETFRRIPFDCSPNAGIVTSKFIFMRGIRHPGKEIVISVVGLLKRGARNSRWIGSTVIEVVNGCPPHVVGTDGSGESIRWEELKTHKWPTYPEISHDVAYVVNFSSWLFIAIIYGVPEKRESVNALLLYFSVWDTRV